MLILLTVAVAIQLVYAFCFFVRVLPLHGGQGSTAVQPVSVVICARNEAGHLGEYLPVILQQQYPAAYQVVVADDASTDGTADVLLSLKKRYPHLDIVTIAPGEPRTFKGKKFAQGQGVAAARYDWLVFTDADCVPASLRWLQLMAAPLARGKEIAAGYGGYSSGPGLLNGFIRWETLHTFIQYSTYALAGLPYMAVGRNMACTKRVYQAAQSGAAWNRLPSGDDDLLVATCATRDNFAVIADPEAFTISEPKHSWREWAAQKRRHLSTGKYYRAPVRLLLAVYAVAHALTWLAFLTLLFRAQYAPAVALMGLRCVLYWWLWRVCAARLGEKKLSYLFPLFDLGWLVYNFVFLPYIGWKTKERWT